MAVIPPDDVNVCKTWQSTDSVDTKLARCQTVRADSSTSFLALAVGLETYPVITRPHLPFREQNKEKKCTACDCERVFVLFSGEVMGSGFETSSLSLMTVAFLAAAPSPRCACHVWAFNTSQQAKRHLLPGDGTLLYTTPPLPYKGGIT